MRKKAPLPSRCFFAAANGSDGFHSYFDSIFSSEALDGVFILKGGPGTGKSTLLREAVQKFQRPNIQTEVFLCSSDPDSLDGVLFIGEGGSACILDGTAPHAREAYLPGAADEIVDLGKCFDNSLLRSHKEAILRLQSKKSLAYKEAYFYLRLFGAFEEKIKAELLSRLDEEKVKTFVSRFFSFEPNKKKPHFFSPRPIKAFCHAGTICLNSYQSMAEKSHLIYGDETECGVLLSAILSAFRAEKHGGYYAPSPRMADLTDGLIFNDFKTAILSTNDKNSAHFFASDFFKKQDSDTSERTNKYRAEEDHLLGLAREALISASEAHFALEKIYTPAVHFEALNSVKEALFEKISSLLSITEIS